MQCCVSLMPVTKVETRQSILDTAQQLVARKGSTAVGLNEVLAASGVHEGSIYYYFSSENTFGEAMLKSYFDAYLTTMDRIFAEADKSSAERLVGYWDHFHATQSVDECQGRGLVVKLGTEVADLSELMRIALRDGFAEYFQRYDALPLPVSPLPAHEHGLSEFVINGETVSAAHIQAATVPFNLTGLPALSMRFGTSSDGMPIGVQLAANWLAESTIPHLASLLESVSPVRDLHPAIWSEGRKGVKAPPGACVDRQLCSSVASVFGHKGFDSGMQPFFGSALLKGGGGRAESPVRGGAMSRTSAPSPGGGGFAAAARNHREIRPVGRQVIERVRVVEILARSVAHQPFTWRHVRQRVRSGGPFGLRQRRPPIHGRGKACALATGWRCDRCGGCRAATRPRCVGAGVRHRGGRGASGCRRAAPRRGRGRARVTRKLSGRPCDATSMSYLPLDFEAFHRMHRPVYIRWARMYLGNRADAEDAVDCAFEQLLVSWPDVLAKESPAAYAWQVMKHRTIDAARARGRREVLMDMAAFETTALRQAVDPIGQLEESISLYQAICGLPERQRDVVVLLYSYGLSPAGAADHLGITAAGVRSTARYARRRLREALGLTQEGHADDTH